MKLLIVTQKVRIDDPILGFFHRWILEFAKHAERLTVICLEEGAHELPPNVRVLSLGKEKSGSRIPFLSRVIYLLRLFAYIWSERREYDVVFVHMNPEYIVLAGWLWKMLRKPIYLWYTHKSVTKNLAIAERYVTKIFSASVESFRLPTEKLVVTGHGIDTDVFCPPTDPGARVKGSLVSVGRVSPTKNQLAMVKAAELLADEGWNGKLTIVGSGVTPAERDYMEKLTTYVATNALTDRVIFAGDIPHEDVPACYMSSDVFINLSATGSMDKAVLEAMACGTKVLTSNEAFKNILPPKYLTTGTVEDVADKTRVLMSLPAADPALRECVVKNHSLAPLIARMMTLMNSAIL